MSTEVETLYRTNARGGDRQRGTARWWLEDKADLHKSVWRVVQNIRERQNDRKKEFLLYASLYANLPRLGFGINSYARMAQSAKIALNVCQSATDALTAKITKERPRPTFLTEEGDYSARLKAESLEAFVEGKLYEVDFYEEMGTPAVLNACIFGTGVVKIPTIPKVLADEDDVTLEHVYPWELMVDEREGLYGKPAAVYQRKFYDKIVLADRFPEMSEQIEKCVLDKDPEEFDFDEQSDQILVIEAWRVAHKGRKGVHAICIQNCGLLVEDYDDEDPPFEFLRALRPPLGFWGIGIVEKLAGLQLAINKHLMNIEKSMHLMARPHWMVPNDAKVMPGHLNNDIATIIKYAGNTPPTVYTPQAMSQQVFDHLQWLYQKSFEIVGVSQLSAQGVKPAGLNSGEAQRVYSNIESERFIDLGRAYEGFVMGVAKKIVARARKVAEQKKGYVARAASKSAFKRVRWSDVDLKEDEYIMKVFPTATLPKEPAGRLSYVQEMLSAKMIDPEDGMDLLDFPDTAEYAALHGAPRKVILRNVEAILKDGKGIVAEPTDNHDLAIRLVNLAYSKARLDGVPEARKELLRRYLDDNVRWKNKLTQAPPGAPGPMQPPPPMPPGMPPPGMPPGPPPVGVPLAAAPLPAPMNGAPPMPIG